MIRTTDGGKSWAVRTVAGAENQDFRGIRAFDAENAIIMSTGNAEKGLARIYRTSDGGQKWTLVFETKTTGIFFDSIAFWDQRRGIVLSDPVDGHFILFRTDDGGTTWKQIPPSKFTACVEGRWIVCGEQFMHRASRRAKYLVRDGRGERRAGGAVERWRRDVGGG